MTQRTRSASIRQSSLQGFMSTPAKTTESSGSDQQMDGLLKGSLRELPSGSIPVLCYHRFLPNFTQLKNTVFSVLPENLEQQFRLLATERIRTLTLAQYAAIATGRAPAERNSALVTIDDGYADVVTQALPLAEKYGINLNLFVLTQEAGRNSVSKMIPGCEEVANSKRENPREWEMLSWDELRELSERGVGIGMHGHTHEKMSEVPLSRMSQDLREGMELFEHELGFQPEAFAIPYGNPYSYTTASLRLLHEVGFKVIFSTERGCSMVPHLQNPLPRHVVAPTDSLKDFELKLQGSTKWSFQLKRILRPHPRLALP